jgi:hypothetical protein
MRLRTSTNNDGANGTGQADEVLQVRIFLDLLDGFHVRQTQFVLDDHRADHSPRVYQRPASVRPHPLVIALRQFVPRDALAQFYPAIVFIQSGLERPVEFSYRQLF